MIGGMAMCRCQDSCDLYDVRSLQDILTSQSKRVVPVALKSWHLMPSPQHDSASAVLYYHKMCRTCCNFCLGSCHASTCKLNTAQQDVEVWYQLQELKLALQTLPMPSADGLQ